MTTVTPASLAVGEVGSLIPSFERSLRVGNKSQRTIDAYGDTTRQFTAFLAETGMPTEVANITSSVLELPAADPVGCRLVVSTVDFAPRRSS